MSLEPGADLLAASARWGLSDLPAAITVREFLENVPPGGNPSVIQGLGGGNSYGGWSLQLPIIQLHCDKCDGLRFFGPTDVCEASPHPDGDNHFVGYLCQNCRLITKTYALWCSAPRSGLGHARKFGEQPAFGPPTPRRLLNLVEGVRDLFLKGRRSENQGLGIAAYSYYRRVVESQKNDIIDYIIKVAERVHASPDVIADLRKARAETQFSKAVSEVKHGIPESLLISGHNPLTLLHDALSEGIHAQTDEECLALATSIRVVLAQLVERVDAALKDEAEVNSAVSALLKAKAARAGKPPEGGT